MTMTVDVETGEVVEPTGPPAPAPAPLSVFGDTPAKAYRTMEEAAEILRVALPKYGMTETMEFGVGPRKRRQVHVTAEGWAFAAGLVGISTRTRWTRPWEGTTVAVRWEGPRDARRRISEEIETRGWECYEEVVNAAGVVIGGHEGMCVRAEARWGDADEYAIRSMAQTRARSQALAGVLRHLVEMAGFRGTPAEEMRGVADRDADAAGDAAEYRRSGPIRPVFRQWSALWSAFDRLGATPGVGKEAFRAACRLAYGVDIKAYADLGERRNEAFRRAVGAYYRLMDDGIGEGAFPPPTDAEVIAAFAAEFPEAAPALFSAVPGAGGGGSDPSDAATRPDVGSDDDPNGVET